MGTTAELAEKLIRTITDVKHTCFLNQIEEMTKGENYVLFYLFFHGGKATPSELSHSLSVTTARIAATLKSLEQKGFVLRQADEKDGRKIIVTITDAGIRQVEKKQNIIYTITVDMLHQLGEQDAKEFVRLMDRVMEIHQGIPREMIEKVYAE